MKRDEISGIKFHFKEKLTLRHRNSIKAVVVQILQDAGLRAKAINYIFCSDEEVWRINLEYLKHDTYTDIITFDLSDTPGDVVADIFISADRVKENAKTHEVTFSEEILRVIFHGALHLAGLRDKTARDIKLMRSKEQEFIKLFSNSSTKHGFATKHKS